MTGKPLALAALSLFALGCHARPISTAGAAEEADLCVSRVRFDLDRSVTLVGEPLSSESFAFRDLQTRVHVRDGDQRFVIAGLCAAGLNPEGTRLWGLGASRSELTLYNIVGGQPEPHRTLELGVRAAAVRWVGEASLWVFDGGGGWAGVEFTRGEATPIWYPGWADLRPTHIHGVAESGALVIERFDPARTQFVTETLRTDGTRGDLEVFAARDGSAYLGLHPAGPVALFRGEDRRTFLLLDRQGSLLGQVPTPDGWADSLAVFARDGSVCQSRVYRPPVKQLPTSASDLESQVHCVRPDIEWPKDARDYNGQPNWPTAVPPSLPKRPEGG